MVWYVDDLKISHVDEKVVMSVLKDLEEEFGPLPIKTGNNLEFLGINFQFTDKGTGKLYCRYQIEEVKDMFPEKIDREVRSPDAHGLIKTSANAIPLNEERAKIFHSIVMKLMWLEKRPDLELSISFLSSRVKQPMDSDWAKLKRVLQYLYSTIDDVRIIGIDDLNGMFTWVDASYAIHGNMRGHTGGCMSMGTGTLHCKASKQKLNAKSSTETEIIGVSEYIPYNVWYINFMEAQGYHIKYNILYQDNQSAIRMERNGRNSCTGNSRHIHIRYFFVKDRVDKGEVEVLYCPTEQMLADFFTKPLQGALFEKFKSVIMGHQHISIFRNPSN